MIAFFEDTSFFTKLEQLFEQNQVQAVGWCDYQHLEKRLREIQPEIVLLDIEINTQQDAGLRALEKIKENFPKVKAIILSGHQEHVVRAFRLGADGYLLKEEITDSMEYIQDAIKEARGGHILMSEKVKSILVKALQPFERIEINTREVQILELAASDKNVPQIADVLGLQKKTVETYFRNVRAKLDCHTIQGAVAKAIKAGIIGL